MSYFGKYPVCHEPFTYFASIYDEFQRHKPYNEWVNHLIALFKKYRENVSNILEIGCGTGTISYLLSNNGYNVVGIDSSQEMINIARAKYGDNIQFYCQDARMLKINNNFDCCIAIYDVFNYLLFEKDLKRVFDNIFKILINDGLFIFDINSKYDLLHSYQENLYQTGDRYRCYSEYEILEKGKSIVQFTFKFYPPKGKSYYIELHRKRGYKRNEIKKILKSSKFKLINVFDGFSFKKARKKTRQFLFIAKKDSK
ncbi:MAG: class I SAM-dependent DNA methyltransferase [Promethearchaeota archaeon]